MAVVFEDTFDHYVTADITQKWYVTGGTLLVGAYGRNSTSGLRCGGSEWASVTCLAGVTTAIAGVAVKVATHAVEPSFIAFGSASYWECGVKLLTNLTLQAVRFNSGSFSPGSSLYATSIGSPSTFALQVGSWYYIEVKVVMSDTVGTVTVWVDGAEVLAVTGQDTIYQSSALTRFGIGSYTTEILQFDDVYVANTAGGVNDDLLGDVRVDAHYPDANGSDSTMTRSTGGDDYAVLDETPVNTTDYLSSDAVDERTSVNVEALKNAGGSIKAVQVSAYLTKQNAGTAVVKPYVLRGGSRYYGSEWYPGWGSWRFFTYVWDNDPVTSSAWTESNFNSSEFGLERTT